MSSPSMPSADMRLGLIHSSVPNCVHEEGFGESVLPGVHRYSPFADAASLSSRTL